MDKQISKSTHSTFKKSLLISLGLLGFIILISVSLGRSEKSLNADLQKLRIVQVAEGVFTDYIPLDGLVQPLKVVIINAVEAGYVEEMLVEEGSFVKQGEPLVRLSNSDLQLEYMNKEALLLDQLNNIRNTRISLDQNHIQLRQQLLDIEHAFLEKKRIYERNQILFAKNVIALADFEKSEDEFFYLQNKQKLLSETIRRDSVFLQNQIAQLESNSRLIDINLQMVKRSLDNLLIRAPVSGQLTSLTGEIGEYKTKGQPLGQIDVREGYKLRAQADEHYISRINKGQNGEFSFGGYVHSVVVDKVFPQVTNGQFPVDMVFENSPPEGIKPGQSLPVKLRLGSKNRTLMIPKGSFYQQTSGMWIFVVNEGKARKRAITLGRQNPTHYEITGGLQAGEYVVISSYEAFENADELILRE